MSLLSLINELGSTDLNLTSTGCRGQAAARRRQVKCQQTLGIKKILQHKETLSFF